MQARSDWRLSSQMHEIHDQITGRGAKPGGAWLAIEWPGMQKSPNSTRYWERRQAMLGWQLRDFECKKPLSASANWGQSQAMLAGDEQPGMQKTPVGIGQQGFF